jgi:3-oxoadipate enol-lactonase
MPENIEGRSFNTSDNCSIEYKLRPARHSGARRLALIHSLALDGSIWDGVAREFAGEVELLTYDCRGHGQSERVPGPFTTDLFASDLAELLDQLNWPSAAVAGCSMGGCVAMAFAGLNPARTTALGLIDTTAWYGESAPKDWRERAANARSKGFQGMIEFQLKRWFSERFRKEHPGAVKQLSEVFVANDLECYAASCQMLGEADLRPYLGAVRVPTAIIVGEEDDATPPPMSKFLHNAISGSTLRVLPGGKHLTPVEFPDRIASLLLELVRRPEPQEAAAEA